MNNQTDENKVVTMTEKQLEDVIRMAVKTAMHEFQTEKYLPVYEKDERQEAPAFFSLLENIASVFLLNIVVVSCIFIYAFGKIIFAQTPIVAKVLSFICIFDILVIAVLAGKSIYEVQKTKKIEVLNSFFSAIMALAGLIVAIVGAVFAYKAL